MADNSIDHVRQNVVFNRLLKSFILAIVVYGVAIIYFFPILYMFLSGFKTEVQAVTPRIFFTPTLETYRRVLGDATMKSYLHNSLFHPKGALSSG